MLYYLKNGVIRGKIKQNRKERAMGYFIALAAILGATFAASYLANEKFESIFPIVNLSTIAVLYCFGLFGALRAGCGFALATSLILVLISLFLRIKRRHGSAHNRAPQYFGIIISVFALFQYIALSGMQVFSWDELTHWALVVKNMFYRGDFGGGAGATTMFPGYPVGSSLFLYFFEAFSPEFEPSHLYMAMNLANLGFIFPIAASMRTLRRKLAATGMLLGLLLLFNFTTLATVWNDMILATLFSYIMAVYFTAGEGNLPLSGGIGIVLASFVLTLAKSTGIAFVLFAYAIIFADSIARHKTVKLHPVLIFSALCATLAGKLSWSVYTDAAGLGAAWDTGGLTLGATLEYLTSPTKHQLDVTGAYVLQFFLPIKYHGNGYHTPIPMVLIAILVIFLLVRVARYDGSARRAVSLGIAIGATYLIYSIATLLTYLFSFSAGEALALASYARYMNTYAIGILIMLATIISGDHRGTDEKAPPKRALLRTLLVIPAVCLAICPAVHAVMGSLITPYDTYINTVKSLDTDAKIYQITTGNGEFLTTAPEEYLVLRFLATPLDSNGLKEGGSPYIGDMWEAEMSAEATLAAYSSGGYNVLYLHRLDGNARSSLSALFASDMEEYTFYVLEDGVFIPLEVE